nr:MAG: capsid protein [Crogonang virus 82]
MPRDCTAIFRLDSDVQSPVHPHRVPNTMKMKYKMKTSRDKEVEALKKKVSKMKVTSTPFGDVGANLGGAVGSMFYNRSIGNNLGRWLGTGIGSIFGSGDYHLSGASPAYNVLANGAQIPKFDTATATNVICHREYLGDINGTTLFDVTSYPLNPGSETTFPWLSQVATNYQEYKFHGCIFEFRPLITDFVTSGAPGVIIMATNYNAVAPEYTTKQQMENTEFAVSVKPTLALIHGIECDPAQTIIGQRNVRTGEIPAGSDKRLYDYGTFQLATQGNPVQLIGELWVSYCVEFFKPIISTDAAQDAEYIHISRNNSVAISTPFGLNALQTVGTLPVVVSGPTSVTFTPHLASTYQVTWILGATTPFADATNPSLTITGATVRPFLTNTAGTIDSYGTPSGFGAAGAGVQSIVTRFITTGSTLANVTITPTVDTLPGTVVSDLFITEVSGALQS